MTVVWVAAPTVFLSNLLMLTFLWIGDITKPIAHFRFCQPSSKVALFMNIIFVRKGAFLASQASPALAVLCPAGVKEVFPELAPVKCCLKLKLFGPKFLTPRFALRTWFRNAERKKEFWKPCLTRRRLRSLAKDEEGCLLNSILEKCCVSVPVLRSSPLGDWELGNSGTSYHPACICLNILLFGVLPSRLCVWRCGSGQPATKVCGHLEGPDTEEFKKTPLLCAAQYAVMKLLTELYSVCSAYGPGKTEILSCASCHLSKIIWWSLLFEANCKFLERWARC